MIGHCNCGKNKTVSPHKNSGQVPWICPACAEAIHKGVPPVQPRPKPALFAKPIFKLALPDKHK